MMLFARIGLIASLLLIAGCKPAEPPPIKTAKRAILLRPIPTQFIELEDGSRYGMGENLYNRLVTRLKADARFVVLVDESSFTPGATPAGVKSISGTGAKVAEFDPSDRLHFEFKPLPAAEFDASIEGLSFLHGSRALRNFSGFRRDFRTPWNSGAFTSQNEFPPRSLDFEPSWFGANFEPIGSANNNTITGVDAGAEGELNLIIARVNYRRDQFYATGQIDARIRLVSEDIIRTRPIEVEGKGFLFALGVGISALNVEFSIVKRDALKKTFDAAAEQLVTVLGDELAKVPFRTRVEEIGAEGIVLSAGRREGIKLGDRFELARAGGSTTLEVSEVFQVGSIAKVVAGIGDVVKGDLLVLREGALDPDMAPPPQGVKLGRFNRTNNFAGALGAAEMPLSPKKITFDAPEFSLPDGEAQNALSLKSTILLPFLLARYAQYDQELNAQLKLETRSRILEKATAAWNLAQIGVSEAWRAEFPAGQGMGAGARVAVIDSGIDYNHRNLAQAFDRKAAGFDFFGFDARPFDDNSHGTALAGIIAAQGVANDPVGIAPDARLLSYRIFNPYGETRSAQIHAAFARAIADGARVIVCGWATARESKAIEAGVALAKAANVLVIAASGDRGANLAKSPAFPASLESRENLITVAAIDANRMLVARPGRFSNYGPSVVDIAAPGDNLNVLAPRSEYLNRSESGLAAAHVAGVAALLISKRPALGAKELKRAILDGAARDPKLTNAVAEGRILNAPGALRASN